MATKTTTNGDFAAIFAFMAVVAAVTVAESMPYYAPFNDLFVVVVGVVGVVAVMTAVVSANRATF